VNAQMRPVGIAELQRVLGIARTAGKDAIYLALAGFTPQAQAWVGADRAALFTFDLVGDVVPLNRRAEELLARGQVIAP
jgi:hypothetical protein